jgi:sulfite exporter TauE/SafE
VSWLDWLATPLSGSSSHYIAPWAMWHARCMVLAWGVMLPLGALVARYFKVLPTQDWPRELDHKAWWNTHRVLQWAGVGVMTVGVALAWGQAAGASTAARVHAWAGWALVVLGWLQVAAGLVRGSKGGPTDVQMHGDHYDMTARRLVFERWHKGLGWLAIVAAVAVIMLGLMLVDAPRWMPLSLVLWWCGLGVAAALWQRQGRCIDTYQAIWGPDPRHPGNHLRPVGWGVRRPLR